MTRGTRAMRSRDLLLPADAWLALLPGASADTCMGTPVVGPLQDASSCNLVPCEERRAKASSSSNLRGW
eukprot:Skav220586  [mRNA]  locus=scaffold145:311531:314102:- [translate_table: standard]